jgi:hypothetical protein
MFFMSKIIETFQKCIRFQSAEIPIAKYKITRGAPYILKYTIYYYYCISNVKILKS